MLIVLLLLGLLLLACAVSSNEETSVSEEKNRASSPASHRSTHTDSLRPLESKGVGMDRYPIPFLAPSKPALFAQPILPLTLETLTETFWKRHLREQREADLRREESMKQWRKSLEESLEKTWLQSLMKPREEPSHDKLSDARNKPELPMVCHEEMTRIVADLKNPPSATERLERALGIQKPPLPWEERPFFPL